MVWYNPHPKKHDFAKDRYECLQGAMQSSPPTSASGTDIFGDPYSYDMSSDTRNDLFIACMNAKGWVLKQAVPPAKTAAQN